MDTSPEQALALIKNQTYGRLLLDHERQKNMSDNAGTIFYRNSKGNFCPLSGACPRLAALFWHKHDSLRLCKTTVRDNRTKPRGAKGKKVGGFFGGLVRGTKVHTQVHDCVVHDRKTFKKLYGKMHPFTANILRVIVNQLKLQPFMPECGIFDERIGIGTRIDMVCLDTEGQLVLTEFKTGYQDCFRTANHRMDDCLSRLSDTPENRAIIQLVCSAVILQEGYGIAYEAMKLYVIRVDEINTEIVPVPPEFLQKMGPLIYDALLRFNREKKAKRRALYDAASS